MFRAMLARSGGRSDLERADLVFEPKLDGTRALCYKDGQVRFINRRDRDITSRYPDLDIAASIRAVHCVLDGEIVVFDRQGNPSFPLLQKREQAPASMYHLRAAQHPATYVVFDVLQVEGRDLTALPLRERRAILDGLISEGASLREVVQTRDGRRMWDLIVERGIEGVMAKDPSSGYEQGVRSSHWLKIKTLQTVDCVIVGYTHEIRAVSSLALGLHDDEGLHYVGRVGTGFTEQTLDRLLGMLRTMHVEPAPVVEAPDVDVIWVRPELVCVVEYLELTAHRHLRAPSFKGMRDDKGPEECRFDQVT